MTVSAPVTIVQVASDSPEILVDTAMGSPGVRGKSAYEVAIENGFSGTQTQWLESLKADTVILNAGTFTGE